MNCVKRVASALAWGALTHGMFVVAIATLVDALYHGLRTGHGTFRGASAWAANALLVVQFPLLHSYFLTPGGRRWLVRLAPRGLGAELAPTTYALIAILQLLATFTLWSPSGITLHEASGAWAWAMRGAFAASWIFLGKALYDAGLPLQTGYAGWWSVVRGRPFRFGDFPTHGLFRFSRQPVYLGFALVLWTGPVHTLDGLLLAMTWSMYCVAAPLHKEFRYLSAYGERFSRYRSMVPYFLPKMRP